MTSPEQGKFVEEFGGAAITLSGSGVPTALERGVIDGVLTASAGGAKNWHEFLAYNYRFAVNFGNSMIIANEDSFADLSEEHQEAGLFLQFSGGRAGPDGLALTSENGVVVCQTGMGLVWVHDVLGRPISVVRSPRGLGTTNCAFGGPDLRTLFVTESDTGSVLKAEFDPALGISGAPMFSGTTPAGRA